MGQRDPVAGAGCGVEVEANPLAFFKSDRTLGQASNPQLGPLQVGEHSNGPPGFLLDRTHDVVALLMLLLGAVAEIEAEHVGPGLEQRPDHFRAGARRPEGRDDLGVTVTAHVHSAAVAAASGPAIRIARKSLTLVRVGPVTIWSPSASKKPCPSLSASRSFARTPFWAARARVSGVMSAPATSSAPSTPSVSPATAKTPGRPSNSTASDSRNSTLRPPRPPPRTVTVVSPPEISTHGGRAGCPRSAACRAIPAMTLPTSRASPSIASPRMSGVTPAVLATSAAASSDICGVAIITVSARARRGSPGFGVSS